MRFRAFFAASFAFALASGTLGATGCGEDDPATPAASGVSGGSVSGSGGSSAGASGTPDISGVVYEEEATDEALESVIGVQATVDDAKAPLVSHPAANGEAIHPITPATFSWSAALAKRDTSRAGSPLRHILDLVSIREAHAHGEPNNGLVYFLQFLDSNGAPLLRVFTTKTTYTPSATDWAKLVVAGGKISLRVTGARVENNDLVAGGGPFVATAPRTFSIAP